MLNRITSYVERKAARALARRPFIVRPKNALISFTFDDFPRSSILRGGSILRSYGIAGTYYASFGLMGAHAATGTIFLKEDLKLVTEQGHELGCHTFGHCNAWDTPPEAFESSVVQNREALREQVPGAAFRTLSYPISVPRAETKRRVAKYFDCCRCGGQDLNVGTVDLNYLSAFFLEKSRDDAAAVHALIDRNRIARGWLIFATHDISDQPTPYGCKPVFFENIVKYAVDSGASILPVHKAYQALQAGNRESL